MYSFISVVSIPPPRALVGNFPMGISPPQGMWRPRDFDPTALLLPCNDKSIVKDDKFIKKDKNETVT